MRQHLAGREAGILAVALKLHLVTKPGKPAEQSPGAAIDTLDLRIEHDVFERPNDLFGTEPAAVLAGTAGILAQPVLLDDKWELRLDLLARTVMGVAVIDADRGTHAVLAVLGAPTPANQPAKIDEKVVVARVAAVDHGYDEVGVMARDDARRDRGRERLEDRVDDGHRISHPPSHRRRALRAHYLARRQHHFEVAE